MENNEIYPIPEEESEGYTPRPLWQVWAARVGLVLFLLVVAYQIIKLAGVGR